MSADLPRLILIANGFTQPGIAGRVLDAVRGGVRAVQLRDHAASPDAFARRARALFPLLRTRGVTVLVNTRLRTARILRGRRCDAGVPDVGMHVGTRGPTPEEARTTLGADALVGYSAHEATEAGCRGVDYLSYSPVFPTRSKPGHPGVGLPALSRFCKLAAPTPVYALGGVTPEDVRPCMEAGTWGVTVLSGILHASSPYAAARSYRQAIQRAVNP